MDNPTVSQLFERLKRARDAASQKKVVGSGDSTTASTTTTTTTTTTTSSTVVRKPKKKRSAIITQGESAGSGSSGDDGGGSQLTEKDVAFLKKMEGLDIKEINNKYVEFMSEEKLQLVAKQKNIEIVELDDEDEEDDDEEEEGEEDEEDLEFLMNSNDFDTNPEPNEDDSTVSFKDNPVSLLYAYHSRLHLRRLKKAAVITKPSLDILDDYDAIDNDNSITYSPMVEEIASELGTHPSVLQLDPIRLNYYRELLHFQGKPAAKMRALAFIAQYQSLLEMANSTSSNTLRLHRDYDFSLPSIAADVMNARQKTSESKKAYLSHEGQDADPDEDLMLETQDLVRYWLKLATNGTDLIETERAINDYFMVWRKSFEANDQEDDKVISDKSKEEEKDDEDEEEEGVDPWTIIPIVTEILKVLAKSQAMKKYQPSKDPVEKNNLYYVCLLLWKTARDVVAMSPEALFCLLVRVGSFRAVRYFMNEIFNNDEVLRVVMSLTDPQREFSWEGKVNYKFFYPLKIAAIRLNYEMFAGLILEYGARVQMIDSTWNSGPLTNTIVVSCAIMPLYNYSQKSQVFQKIMKETLNCIALAVICTNSGLTPKGAVSVLPEGDEKQDPTLVPYHAVGKYISNNFTKAISHTSGLLLDIIRAHKESSSSSLAHLDRDGIHNYINALSVQNEYLAANGEFKRRVTKDLPTVMDTNDNVYLQKVDERFFADTLSSTNAPIRIKLNPIYEIDPISKNQLESSSSSSSSNPPSTPPKKTTSIITRTSPSKQLGTKLRKIQNVTIDRSEIVFNPLFVEAPIVNKTSSPESSIVAVKTATATVSNTKQISPLVSSTEVVKQVEVIEIDDDNDKPNSKKEELSLVQVVERKIEFKQISYGMEKVAALTSDQLASEWVKLYHNVLRSMQESKSEQKSKDAALSIKSHKSIAAVFVQQMVRHVPITADDVVVEFYAGHGLCSLQFTISTGCTCFGFEPNTDYGLAMAEFRSFANDSIRQNYPEISERLNLGNNDKKKRGQRLKDLYHFYSLDKIDSRPGKLFETGKIVPTIIFINTTGLDDDSEKELRIVSVLTFIQKVKINTTNIKIITLEDINPYLLAHPNFLTMFDERARSVHIVEKTRRSFSVSSTISPSDFYVYSLYSPK